jgi:hypothetical protein
VQLLSLCLIYVAEGNVCGLVISHQRFCQLHGSVLGPLLFSLFINVITNSIESSHYHMNADDVQLYISCHPSEYAACVRRLNLDLDWKQVWS